MTLKMKFYRKLSLQKKLNNCAHQRTQKASFTDSVATEIEVRLCDV